MIRRRRRLRHQKGRGAGSCFTLKTNRSVSCLQLAITRIHERLRITNSVLTLRFTCSSGEGGGGGGGRTGTEKRCSLNTTCDLPVRGFRKGWNFFRGKQSSERSASAMLN